MVMIGMCALSVEKGMKFKMNNEKGFTMVELLGVIAILGIILLIAIGSYSRYIERTRQTAYEAGERGMQGATETLLSDCLIDRTNPICSTFSVPSAGNSLRVPLSVLISEQYMDEIIDPARQDATKCDANTSYVEVVASSSTAGSSNFNLEYRVCLRCSQYQSADCS